MRTIASSMEKLPLPSVYSEYFDYALLRPCPLLSFVAEGEVGALPWWFLFPLDPHPFLATHARISKVCSSATGFSKPPATIIASITSGGVIATSRP